MSKDNIVNINRRQVEGVVEVASKSVATHIQQLQPLEAIIGFAQVCGRAIAAQPGSRVLHQELIKVATRQINDTVIASYKDGDNGT